MMYDDRKSDSSIVPKKLSNKGRMKFCFAEEVEERGLAKGNPRQHNRYRAQNRISLKSALDRIRQTAEKDNDLHLYPDRSLHGMT